MADDDVRPYQDDLIVHRGDVAFRLRVPWKFEELVFEHLRWPSLGFGSRLALPSPSGGYGGAELSISPGARYAGALLYSGQSELGYELFALEPELRHLGGLAYVHGVSDLTPLAFSPDDRLAATAIQQPFWWVDPCDAEPGWDTPAVGGLVTWATVYLHDLVTRRPSRCEVRVDLPAGWSPSGENAWPERLRFAGPRSLTVGIPWTCDFTFDLPAPGDSIVAPWARS